jgi:hypothetical protein
MKFNDFLIESSLMGQPADAIQLVEDILKDCKPYLREVKKNKVPFYRGMKRTKHYNYGVKPIRTDRRPTDSSRAEFQLVNALLADHNLPSRDKVLFALTAGDGTQMYGDPCYIFPKGRYEYFWFPTIDDMYEWTKNTEIDYMFPEGFKSKTSKGMLEEFYEKEPMEEEIEEMQDLLKNFKPTTKPITFISGYELSIYNCKEYYYIKKSDSNQPLIDAIFKGIL